MKVLVFGASNSTTSINKALAVYTSSLLNDAQVESLDLNDFELPLFSEEREKQIGQPTLAKNFMTKISCADAIIVSFAEHNGTYTAAFKNLLDWSTRISREVYQGKPVVFLSTSPGPGGAASVLKAANESAQFFGAKVMGSLSIPNFYDNFDMSKQQPSNESTKAQLESVVQHLQN